VNDDVAGSYGLVVRFEVLDGHEPVFDALVAETVAQIRSSEAGTLVYLTHREATSGGVRVFYELYRDVAAFEAHESMPHVRRFLAERSGHLRSDPLVWRVSEVDGLIRETEWTEPAVTDRGRLAPGKSNRPRQ
jgi:quinol monooxygenase YgiN